MHETEKRNAEIDVIAADINGQAARVLSLAEETARSADACETIAGFGGLFSGGDEASSEQELERRDVEAAHHARERQIAQGMAIEAQNVRDAAAALERLAREMRGNLVAADPVPSER